MFLKPEIKQVIVSGKVFYYEKNRRIQLRKEILDAFATALSKSTDIEYVMELYLDKGIFSKRIEECVSQGVLPILLFFKVKPKA